MKYPKSFEELVDSLKRLPGIGLKSAERMAYQILDMPSEDVETFSRSWINAKAQIHRCSICGQITDEDICDVCQDESRDKTTICVVQNPKDAFAIEKAGEYHGLYHILYGVISAANGISVKDLNIASLIERVSNDDKIKEVIIATNPTTEGETTAIYLAKLLEDYKVTVTRIAYGVPMGANLDYTDEYTLMKALEGRRKI